MPKLITTRMRTSDLGKPGIISIDEGGSGQEIMNDSRISVDLFDDPGHHSIQAPHCIVDHTRPGLIIETPSRSILHQSLLRPFVHH